MKPDDDLYGAAEVAFFDRRATLERELIELLFARNGDCRQGVKLAYAAGICQHTFLIGPHRVLWLAAATAPNTAAAIRLGIAALKQVGHWGAEVTAAEYDQLVESRFWWPEQIQRTAAELARMECAAVDIRLLDARRADLLAGIADPQICLIDPTKVKVAA